MRKRMGILIALLLVVNLALPVSAASKEYEIPELDLTLSIPSKYDVIVRDGKENASLLSKYGISKENMQGMFDSGLYFDALDPQGEEEIVVTVTETDLIDLDGMADASLEFLASSLEEEYTDNGFHVISTGIYRQPPLTFINIDSYVLEEEVYVLQYLTVYNGAILSFALRSYIGSPSGDQVNSIRSVVDSITIPGDASAKARAEETPAFLYLDAKTGTTFTVPANWTDITQEENRENLDAVFSFVKEPSLCILYTSMDLRTFDSELYKDREHLSGPKVCARIAEDLGIPESSVTTETYQEKGYYMVRYPYTFDEYGSELTLIITQAILIENGWAYVFQFFGEPGDWYYGEFENVLKSVAYGEIQPVLHGTGYEKQSQSLFSRVAVSFCSGMILFLFTFVFRKIKTALTAKKAEGNGEKSEFVYCQSCGKRFPAGTRFCDVCGEKIRR